MAVLSLPSRWFLSLGIPTPGLALPGWKSRLPNTNTRKIGSFGRKLGRLELQSHGSRDTGLGSLMCLMSMCCFYPSQGDFPVTWI